MNPEPRDTYEELLQAFGEERIEERFGFVLYTAERFCTVNNLATACFVNSRLIREAILDYFSDIKRLKEFHNIERTNPAKVAAYLTYWLLRRRPIQLRSDLPEATYASSPMLLNVNEWYCQCVILSISFSTKSKGLRDASQLKRWNYFLDNLNYFLTYRHVNPQALELMILALYADPESEPMHA
jgi:hypothetical protein